jgi:hypothetical protein
MKLKYNDTDINLILKSFATSQVISVTLLQKVFTTNT